LEAVSRELDEARREGIARAYYGAIRIARILTGSANSILVSPTLTSVISLALQVTALRDVASVIRNKGFPVYSGGDDVLALTPIERWFEIVRILRSHFWGDEESLFHRIRVGGRNVVIAQAIPTGRSFSVRVADILDIMSHEISIALELLESKAKNAKWVKPYGVFKDSLVLSDSRSGVEVVFPLSMTCGVRRVLVADRVLRTLETMFIAENLGVISSNIPEDLVNMLRDPLTGEKVNTGDELLLEALLRMFKRTLYRNIHVRKDEAIKFKMDPFEVTAGKIVDGIGGDAVLSMWNNDRRRRLLEELVDFVRASRGWL
jgi:CRISPR-associated protein Cmr2